MVDRETVSSKIGERGESFPMGLEAITIEVGLKGVFSWIEIGEGFSMVSSFQELNRNFYSRRVSPGSVGRVGYLE